MELDYKTLGAQKAGKVIIIIILLFSPPYVPLILEICIIID